jgi:hypothetical protein
MGTRYLITPAAILRHSPMKMPVTAARRQNFAWPTISFMVSLTLADHVSIETSNVCFEHVRTSL